jgi:hypothetical protein
MAGELQADGKQMSSRWLADQGLMADRWQANGRQRAAKSMQEHCGNVGKKGSSKIADKLLTDGWQTT